MNKNKIIFLVIWVFLVIFFIIVFLLLSNMSWKTKQKSNSWNDLSIWILQDNKENFLDVLDDFKKNSQNSKNINFLVTTFSNYEEYYNSLVWAFLRWQAPDIFVLNNNDSNIFDSQVLWIDPTLISPDDFRKNFESVFSQDLIRKTTIEEKPVEFLAWIPIWYENLWIFYNFREIKWQKLTTWSYINEIVRTLREENNKVWIWIWNGSTVYGIEDIITQFFLLDGIPSLFEATWNNIKSSLSNYLRYGDVKLENRYDTFYTESLLNNKNNLDLFSKWEIQMIIGYPRLLEEIDKRWFSKGFLRAEVFPMYNENSWKLLINYNYFVINKNTLKVDVANELLTYLSSGVWQKKYLETFPYYMPAALSLLKDRLEENLKDGYNIKYKNFYNKSLELTTFNKNIRTIYDKEIALIIDKWMNSIDLFEIFRKRLLCLSGKIVTWTSLEVSCSK